LSVCEKRWRITRNDCINSITKFFEANVNNNFYNSYIQNWWIFSRLDSNHYKFFSFQIYLFSICSFLLFKSRKSNDEKLLLIKTWGHLKRKCIKFHMRWKIFSIKYYLIITVNAIKFQKWKKVLTLQKPNVTMSTT
jgi:hypothetical protein